MERFRQKICRFFDDYRFALIEWCERFGKKIRDNYVDFVFCVMGYHEFNLRRNRDRISEDSIIPTPQEFQKYAGVCVMHNGQPYLHPYCLTWLFTSLCIFFWMITYIVLDSTVPQIPTYFIVVQILHFTFLIYIWVLTFWCCTTTTTMVVQYGREYPATFSILQDFQRVRDETLAEAERIMEQTILQRMTEEDLELGAEKVAVIKITETNRKSDFNKIQSNRISFLEDCRSNEYFDDFQISESPVRIEEEEEEGEEEENVLGRPERNKDFQVQYLGTKMMNKANETDTYFTATKISDRLFGFFELNSRRLIFYDIEKGAQENSYLDFGEKKCKKFLRMHRISSRYLFIILKMYMKGEYRCVIMEIQHLKNSKKKPRTVEILAFFSEPEFALIKNNHFVVKSSCELFFYELQDDYLKRRRVKIRGVPTRPIGANKPYVKNGLRVYRRSRLWNEKRITEESIYYSIFYATPNSFLFMNVDWDILNPKIDEARRLMKKKEWKGKRTVAVTCTRPTKRIHPILFANRDPDLEGLDQEYRITEFCGVFRTSSGIEVGVLVCAFVNLIHDGRGKKIYPQRHIFVVDLIYFRVIQKISMSNFGCGCSKLVEENKLKMSEKCEFRNLLLFQSSAVNVDVFESSSVPKHILCPVSNRFGSSMRLITLGEPIKKSKEFDVFSYRPRRLRVIGSFWTSRGRFFLIFQNGLIQRWRILETWREDRTEILLVDGIVAQTMLQFEERSKKFFIPKLFLLVK